MVKYSWSLDMSSVEITHNGEQCKMQQMVLKAISIVGTRGRETHGCEGAPALPFCKQQC